MKLINSILLLLILAVSMAFAQGSAANSSTKVGIRFAAGYGMLWNAENPSFNYDYENVDVKMTVTGLEDLGGLALDMGLGMQFPISSGLSLHVDAQASKRNLSTDVGIYAKASGIYDGETISEDTTMNLAKIELDFWNLELPVMLRYQTSPSGIFFEAGPSFSMNMSADISILFLSVDFSDYINSFSVGGVVGVGKSIPTGSGVLDVDFRMSMYFTSLLKDRINTNSGFSSDEIDLSAGEIGEVKVTDFWDPKEMLFHLGVTYWFM